MVNFESKISLELGLLVCFYNWILSLPANSRLIKLYAANVYRTINIITNQPYAVKLKLAMVGGSSVEREYYTLKELIDIAGLPRAHWFGRESNYNALVINLLGPSLHQLLQQHKKLCASTVAYLANQLVHSIDLCLTLIPMMF